MATTKKIKANLNKPTRIKMRAAGKWDMINYHTFTDWYQHYNLPLLIDYNGLKSNNEQLVEAYKCNFGDTTLPWKFDYKNKVNISNYCLMPMGQTYLEIRNYLQQYNLYFTLVGSVSYASDYSYIYNFSTTNYITYNYTPTQNTFDFTCKWTTGTSVTSNHQGILYDQTTSKSLIIIRSTGNLSSYINGEWVEGSYTLNTNTTYWIRLKVVDKQLSCYISIYNNEEECPSLEDMTLSFTVLSQNEFIGHSLRTGVANSNEYMWGTFYIKDTYFYENDEKVWHYLDPYQVIEKKAYFSNYTNVTSDTNGVITGYGNAPSFYVIKKANPFTFQTKVTAPNTSNSTYNYLIDIKTSSGTRLAALGRRSSAFCYYSLSNNSSSSNYTGSWANNTTKWLRIYYPGSSNQTVDGITYTAYYLYFLQSDNGISWSTITSRNISSYFLGTSSSTNQFSYAYFGNNNLAFVTDMKETFINNGGYREYTGAVEKKQSLPGCTYNFNDNGQSTTLNVFTKDKDQGIILTPDNKYSDERLLGTVDIPEHPVYTYVDNTWIETPVFEQDKLYEVVLVGGGGGGSTWPGGAGAYWHGIITPHEDIPVTITVGSGGSGNSGYSRNNNGVKVLHHQLQEKD